MLYQLIYAIRGVLKVDIGEILSLSWKQSGSIQCQQIFLQYFFVFSDFFILSFSDSRSLFFKFGNIWWLFDKHQICESREVSSEISFSPTYTRFVEQMDYCYESANFSPPMIAYKLNIRKSTSLRDLWSLDLFSYGIWHVWTFSLPVTCWYYSQIRDPSPRWSALAELGCTTKCTQHIHCMWMHSKDLQVHL